MDLVQDNQAPLPAGDGLHAALRPAAALFPVADHVIRGYSHCTRALSAATCKRGNVALWKSGPLQELLLPLRYGDCRAAHYQRRLLQGGGGGDADERLAGAAGQDDDAAVGLPAREELCKAALLIRAQHTVAAQADAQRRGFFVAGTVVHLHATRTPCERQRATASPLRTSTSGYPSSLHALTMSRSLPGSSSAMCAACASTSSRSNSFCQASVVAATASRVRPPATSSRNPVSEALAAAWAAAAWGSTAPAGERVRTVPSISGRTSGSATTSSKMSR